MRNIKDMPFGKIIRKFNPFNPIDFLYAESWLEDLASQGLMLHNYNTIFSSKFRVSVPMSRRYRILPYKRSKISDEELMIYEAAGWNYVPSWNCSVFYTGDPDSPEIFTEKRSLKRYYRRWTREQLVSMLFITYFSFKMAKLYPFTFDGSYRNLHAIEDAAAIPFWIYISLITAVLIFWISQAVQIIRVIKFINSNEELVHNRPYKVFYKLKSLLSVFLLVSLIAVLSILAVNESVYNRELLSKDAVDYTESHLYKYSDFNSAVWDDYKYVIAKGDTEIKRDKNADGRSTQIDYSVSLNKSYIFPVNRSEGLQVHTPYELDPSVEYITYSCRYYEARDAKIAQKYIEEDISDTLDFIDFIGDKDFDDKANDGSSEEPETQRNRKTKKDVNAISYKNFEFDYPGLDYAFYKKFASSNDSNSKYSTQLLYLRKGKRFITITYSGNDDLRQKIGEVAKRVML